MKERGETELVVIGDKLLSKALAALGESVYKKGVSFLPTRGSGWGKGRS